MLANAASPESMAITMSRTSSGRFALLTAALGAMLFSALTAGPGIAAATPEPQPVQLALKPVNQPGAYFDLSLEPGHAQDFEVEIGNHGPEAIAARTYAADAYSIINGGFGAEDRDGERSGTTTWLSYPTEVLELGPGQANVRTFTITVPAETLPGQYITSLILENDVPVEGTGSVALDQVVRRAVAVSIRVPGPLEPAFEFGSADHKITADHSVVGVEITNTGNAHVKPAGDMTIRDGSGKTVSEAPIIMDSVYAHNATRVETTLDSILEPGEYTLDITLTDAATKATSTAAAVPFTVTDDEVEKARTAEPAPLPGIFQDTGPGILPYLIGVALVAILGVVFLIFRRRRTESTPAAGPRSARTSRDGGPTRQH